MDDIVIRYDPIKINKATILNTAESIVAEYGFSLNKLKSQSTEDIGNQVTFYKTHFSRALSAKSIAEGLLVKA